jgi:hypothetical protein
MKIKKAKGYLGPYLNPDTVKPGDIQSMVFELMGGGPFWMSPEEQGKKKTCHYHRSAFVTRRQTK